MQQFGCNSNVKSLNYLCDSWNSDGRGKKRAKILMKKSNELNIQEGEKVQQQQQKKEQNKN